jgi:putative ABC transport system permease protein
MSRAHRSRFETRWLLFRHIRSNLGVSLLVAVLTGAIAALVAYAPGAIESTNTAGLTYDLERLSPRERDVVSNEPVPPPTGGPREPASSELSDARAAVWGAFDDELADIRQDMPVELRSAVRAGEYTVAYDPVIVQGATSSAGGSRHFVSLTFDPRMEAHVEIVEGAFPAPLTSGIPNSDALQIALSETSASLMNWLVGETRSIGVDGGARQSVQLSGTFQSRTTGDAYWEHTLAMLRPSVVDTGDGPPTYIAGAYVNPASWPETAGMGVRVQTHAWFPLVASSIRSADSLRFATDVREFSRVRYETAAPEEEFGPPPTRAFRSGALSTIDASIARGRSTDAVLALTLAGPLGVAAAVLWLAAGLIASIRRPGLVLAGARGAAEWQIRGSLAFEGLLAGLPAACVGTVAGVLLRPGSPAVGWETVVLGIAAGLTPAVMLAFSKPGTFRQARSDAGEPRRFRALVEVLILVVSIVSVALLVGRGLTGSVAATGVDPLLSVAPLLLALAGCVLALRLYPIPLDWIVRATHRKAALVDFLGSARALRDPIAGMVPILAMTVGVSVAAFSGVFLTTLHVGTLDAARSRVGADLGVNAFVFTRDDLTAIEQVDGVQSMAVVYDEVKTPAMVNGTRMDITFLVVDVDALRAVQGGRTGDLTLIAELTEPLRKGASIVVSDDLKAELGPAKKMEVGSETLAVAGAAQSDTPLSGRHTWALIDREVAEGLMNVDFSPSVMLLDLAPSAQESEVREVISEVLGESAVISSPNSAAAAQSSNPVVGGLTTGLVAALAISGLLSAVALVITLIINTPARNRILRMLRILGADRKQLRGLLWWELGPMLVPALFAGIVVGHVLPYLVIAGVDLRAFTGGTVQPAIAVNPIVTLYITGAFVVVAGFGVLAAAGLQRRLKRKGPIGPGEGD